MKITLLKDHLDDKKGETIEVTAERGNYLARVGVGKSSNEYQEPKAKKLKKQRKDSVSTVFTPEEHDNHIKHLNKDL